jgi:hypothetical protein
MLMLEDQLHRYLCASCLIVSSYWQRQDSHNNFDDFSCTTLYILYAQSVTPSGLFGACRWIDAGKFLTGFSAVGSIAIPAILAHSQVSCGWFERPQCRLGPLSFYGVPEAYVELQWQPR